MCWLISRPRLDTVVRWGIGVYVWCCCSVCVAAQQTFRVLEYNVENLFDTEHDTLKDDREFLPGSVRGWSKARYRAKLIRIGKVILAAGAGQVPDLVALCEVENERCVSDLVSRPPLREAGYRFVMTDSPDERGIDVALLYQPATFRPLSVQYLRLPMRPRRRPTRDVLHVSGRVLTGDTLDVFVCHLPSRASGRALTEPYRREVAGRIRRAADSLMSCRFCPHVLVMGDFNDGASDPSLAEGLGAAAPAACPETSVLYNVTAGTWKGTYRYRSEWHTFDHVLLNGRLMQPASRIRYRRAAILAFPFLLEEDEDYGGDRPFRTYRGRRYYGGYSDHLPVGLELELVPQE